MTRTVHSRRRRTVVIAALVAVGLLAACGGDDDAGTGDSSGDGSTTSSTAESSDEGGDDGGSTTSTTVVYAKPSGVYEGQIEAIDPADWLYLMEGVTVRCDGSTCELSLLGSVPDEVAPLEVPQAGGSVDVQIDCDSGPLTLTYNVTFEGEELTVERIWPREPGGDGPAPCDIPDAGSSTFTGTWDKQVSS